MRGSSSRLAIAVLIVVLATLAGLTPAFAGVDVTITVATTGEGSGQVFGPNGICKWDGSVQTGSCSSSELATDTTDLIYTAYPADGSSFESWSGCSQVVGQECHVHRPLEGNVTITATFGKAKQRLTVTMPTGGNISGAGINCGDGGTDCTEDVPKGTTETLTATAMQGYSFGTWTGACASATTNVCQVVVNEPTTVGATFRSASTATVTVEPPTGGRVTSDPAGISCGNGGSDCTEGFARGTRVTLTFVAMPGYAFVRWQGACGDVQVDVCVLVVNDQVVVGVVVRKIERCKCHELSIAVPKNEFGDAEGIRPGKRLTRFFFSINWTLTCTAGEGARCHGTVRFPEPKGFDNVKTWRLVRRGNKIVRVADDSPITCGGRCQRNHSIVRHGTIRVNMDSKKSFADLEGTDVKFKVITVCGGTERTYQVTVSMGADGRIKNVRLAVVL